MCNEVWIHCEHHPCPPAPIALLGYLPDDFRAKALLLYGDQSGRAVLRAVLTDGSAAMILYRSMQHAHSARLPLVPAILGKALQIFGNCIIGRGASFGPRLVIAHSLGIVINGAVRGGSDIVIEHQVTIGAGVTRLEAPSIEDGVFLGAGAKVIGAIRIGRGAKIGANAVVVRDVPPEATVVGIPGRIVRLGGARVVESPSPAADGAKSVSSGLPEATQ